MSRFTVVWLQDAQNQLAVLWMDAADLRAVADAANAIDSVLATDALTVGVHLREGLYSFELPPLRVLYSVNNDDRIVEVASIKRLDRPTTGPQASGEAHPS